MKHPALAFLLLITALLFILPGCYYDNEEFLYPTTKCDSSNVTFSGTVAPILAANCNGCHSSALPSGNVVTDNVNSVKASMTRIWGSINQTGSYIPMPQNLPKLSNCDLAKIGVWKNAGMPSN